MTLALDAARLLETVLEFLGFSRTHPRLAASGHRFLLLVAVSPQRTSTAKVSIAAPSPREAPDSRFAREHVRRERRGFFVGLSARVTFFIRRIYRQKGNQPPQNKSVSVT
jgi:hypothetical protein